MCFVTGANHLLGVDFGCPEGETPYSNPETGEFEDATIEGLLDQLGATAPVVRAPATGEYAGKTVCFTGDSRCQLEGQPLSREGQERLAAEVGMTAHPRLTKKVDVLVVAYPGYQSGKTEKAALYGTRVVAESDFWRAVGVEVDG